ncbi:MAG: thioredoxin domain-containing protein [Opitutaceae bacterium]|nr:thioredoxin domain-containing protein [Opitutaceae bacterium]
MPNALAGEKSPYLLQHASNPVEWLPWGERAFAKARAEQKPIFLSIGYSTCHWCHVMAHESFENEAIAKILNEHFVPVKVDREERPDVDKVYMAYVQAMTGHGGWPLSAWLTPELKPFYGGTYFPPDERHGRPGFPGLLLAIARGWKDQREQLLAEGERVLTALRDYYAGKRGEENTVKPAMETREQSLVEGASKAFEKGFEYFYEAFDATHGGFGGAPKFPRASNLTFLMRVVALQGRDSQMGGEAVKMVSATLQAMARGGIHDHVGGGFHRYSVDETWFVPHFEKMLYDQAQIAVNCLEARQATGDERFAWLARDIFDYVERDLTSPEGAFYTAEDADSPLPDRAAGGDGPGHAEGAFYVWSAVELRRVLAADFPFFAWHFGIEENGNVPAQLDPQAEFRGKNILHQRRSLLDTARKFSLTPETANERLMASLAKLSHVRAQRPRPHLDDKVLTANNGLMISALARAHQVLGDLRDPQPLTRDDSAGEEPAPLPASAAPARSFLERAERAAAFIERELYDRERGVLFRAWRHGRGTAEGFAEDYAFLVQGLLDLYEASFDLRWLQWADRLQVKMDELFWDEAAGGYFNSAANDASIVLRLKEDYDGAEPAPSSVAALNLLRLAAMLNDDARRERGRATLVAFQSQWGRAAHAVPQMLCALELALEPPRHVVLAGNPAAPEFQALTAVLHERPGPRRILLGVTTVEAQSWLGQRAPWLAEMRARDGHTAAYVCEEYACQAPVSEPEELRRLIG